MNKVHLWRCVVGLLITGFCCAAGHFAAAADWPAYRADCRRSGYTAETLPRKLSLAWTHKSGHPPQPAWSGRDTRMPFDCAFHPVIAGKTLFFGSSVDCKVYAVDAASGAERWTFFTDGPVRLAPATWTDRVLVAGDDGWLYCLAAGDGGLVWKLRGGPADSMLLGNDRMISRWPARGGPVIADDVVYFAAGIWPSEGIFVYAVDAATGRVRWCNDSSGAIYMPQPHGGANANSGISAQGHLVVAGDRLLVPTGRAVPAALKRSDGKLLYFHLQANRGNGGADVVSADSMFFGGGLMFDPTDGATVGNGVNAATMSVTPKGVVYVRRDAIVISPMTRKEVTDRKGNKSIVPALGEPRVLASGVTQPVRSLIVAGEAIVIGRKNHVTVLDEKSGQSVFASEVEGVPYGLAVADGRLFVSTDQGAIHCFDGEDGHHPAQAKRGPSTAPYRNMRLVDAAAEEIIRQCGVDDGYCLDLACGDGGLACALASRTSLRIYAIDPDPANVARARQRLDEAGLYGLRVTVHQGDPAATAYPNYFADLVVSGRSVTEGPDAVSRDEVRRLCRPFGGTACIGKVGKMTKTVRGPLEEAGSWTHQYCDPANTNCSTDTIARGPLGMLWFTDLGFQVPSRHGRGPAPLLLDGRLFIEGVDGLRCVNAYNGRTLWDFPLPRILAAYDQEHLMGTAGTGSNFCIAEGGLYIRTGGKCLCIDPATGKLRGQFEAPKRPDGRESTWAYIACDGGNLFGTTANRDHLVQYRYGRSDMSTQFTESNLLFALDAESGDLKWRYEPKHSIRNNAIAIAAGRVYLIDRPPARRDDPRLGDKEAPHEPGVLIAVDAGTGNVLWTVGEDVYGTMLAASAKHDVLLMSYQDTRFKLDSEIGGRMTGFRASDGTRLWDLRAPYGSRPIINDRTIYAQPGAWDLLTGRQKQFEFRRSYGCGTLAGSKHLLVYRSATLGYTDLTGSGGTTNYGGIRPGCWINAIPAGGLVLMPDATDRCTCSYLIKSSIALQPMP